MGPEGGPSHILPRAASTSLPCRAASCSPSRTLRCSSSFSWSSSSLSFSTWGWGCRGGWDWVGSGSSEPHLPIHWSLELHGARWSELPLPSPHQTWNLLRAVKGLPDTVGVADCPGGKGFRSLLILKPTQGRKPFYFVSVSPAFFANTGYNESYASSYEYLFNR